MDPKNSSGVLGLVRPAPIRVLGKREVFIRRYRTVLCTGARLPGVITDPGDLVAALAQK
ncbi:hypothetical protein [Halorussus halobius]|uniref:hypothetical protein n=1 Tax=Halorussus halobius TaxID=1710537 RepID=UPI00143DC71D|nr:hypothetical protein [Halorussus halobius]